MRLSIREGVLYMLLGQHVIGTKGILDLELVSIFVAVGCEDSSSTIKRISWYEITYLDAQKCEDIPMGMFWRNNSSSNVPV